MKQEEKNKMASQRKKQIIELQFPCRMPISGVVSAVEYKEHEGKQLALVEGQNGSVIICVRLDNDYIMKYEMPNEEFYSCIERGIFGITQKMRESASRAYIPDTEEHTKVRNKLNTFGL